MIWIITELSYFQTGHKIAPVAQITAILDGKRIIAPPKEVLEVQNALKAYEFLSKWQYSREQDLRHAHQALMAGLLSDAGHYRQGSGGGNVGR